MGTFIVLIGGYITCNVRCDLSSEAVSLQFLSSLATSHYKHAQTLYIAEIVAYSFVWLP